MSNEYITIPDALINVGGVAGAGYMPVRSRLMKRYARNIDACASLKLTTYASGSTSSSSFTTVDTIKLFIPDWYIGTGGTTFQMSIDCESTESGAGGAGQFRITVDGNASQTENVGVFPGNGSEAQTFTFTVTFTPTGNTVVDVDLDCLISASGDAAIMTGFWLAMHSFPRAI